MKTIMLPFAILTLLGSGFTSPTPALGQGDNVRSSTKRAPQHTPPRRADTQLPAAGTPNRQPNRHFPPNYYLKRPLGSATNTPRGFYNHHLSHDGSVHNPGPVYLAPPVYYVAPPLFPDRFDYHHVSGPEEAVNPTELGAGNARPVIVEADEVYVVPPESARPDTRDRSYEYGAEPYAYEPPPRDRRGGGRSPSRVDQVHKPRPPRQPQTVTLQIEPADAVVWLDDEPLGPAGEVAESIVLEPGVYLLEVEHGELEPQRLFFGVVDQAVDVRVDLRVDEPRRRYRVR
ncbi:MAG: hypothetical protein MPN21_06440 [Thermoanaerobaculia bacterium]|nr:hypothetical protein [Thermoanaerobaculia bacterium]